MSDRADHYKPLAKKKAPCKDCQLTAEEMAEIAKLKVQLWPQMSRRSRSNMVATAHYNSITRTKRRTKPPDTDADILTGLKPCVFRGIRLDGTITCFQTGILLVVEREVCIVCQSAEW